MGLFAALGVWEPTRRGCGAMMVRIGLWPLNILAQGLLGGSWVVIRGVNYNNPYWGTYNSTYNYP